LGRWRAACLVAAIAGLAMASRAAAQEDPVAWTLAKTPASATAGQTFRIQLTATIEAGWHVYSVSQPPPPIATRISLPKGQPFTLDGVVDAPAPHVAFDAGFGIDTESYAESAVFTLPIKVSAQASGRQVLRVQAYYQTCNDKFCLPPKTVTLETPIDVKAGKQAGGTAEAPVTPASGTPVPSRDSLLSFVWLAMMFGGLSLLTPCVFPMVPITVSYFTGHAAGSRGRAVRNASIYAVGIILTFTGFGLVLALLAGATSLNRFAANPWINLLITAIFVGFALNLFGFYEIRIPSGLLTRLDTATRTSAGGSLIGTLLMALTFTLASISCTAPFIGTLLVMAAGGDWQWPLIGMLAFSTVLAFPFFLLALMPQLLASLPRSGGWMNAVKVMLGFVVVAASTKFLSNADLVWGWGFLTRDVVLGSWVAVALLMMAYILGMFRFEHDSPVKHVGIVRLAFGLVCGTLAFWLASGLAGKPLGELDALLPLPLQAAGATRAGGAGELSWLVNDYDGALAEARRTSRRVFVDFTGYTCTNCKWMETNMFPRDDVRAELEKFVRLRMYTDGAGEIFQRQQRRQQAMFKTVALPYYAILEADGTPVATFPGLTRDPAEFVTFLKKGTGPTAD
jgi:thiol:disulfide interchange protein DsbD